MKNPLQPEELELLCLICDPQAEAPAVPPDRVPAFTEASIRHNVAPILFRRLKEAGNSGDIASLQRVVETQIGHALMLQPVVRYLETEIETRTLAACIIKGPRFAESLYPHPSDRPYGDIDVLAHPDARGELAEIMADAGYALFRKPVFDRTRIRDEEKWVGKEHSDLLVEIHGNLVHYPKLRQRISFGYRQYQSIMDHPGDTARAQFFLAIVHGCLGHKLHQLRLLIDILQAFRNLSPKDRAILPSTARKLGLELETNLCLHLLDALFAESGARDLSREVQLSATAKRAINLVSKDSILQAPFQRTSSLRRTAFRLMQHRVQR